MEQRPWEALHLPRQLVCTGAEQQHDNRRLKKQLPGGSGLSCLTVPHLARLAHPARVAPGPLPGPGCRAPPAPRPLRQPSQRLLLGAARVWLTMRMGYHGEASEQMRSTSNSCITKTGHQPGAGLEVMAPLRPPKPSSRQSSPSFTWPASPASHACHSSI